MRVVSLNDSLSQTSRNEGNASVASDHCTSIFGSGSIEKIHLKSIKTLFSSVLDDEDITESLAVPLSLTTPPHFTAEASKVPFIHCKLEK
jgi:hypothetical protein